MRVTLTLEATDVSRGDFNVVNYEDADHAAPDCIINRLERQTNWTADANAVIGVAGQEFVLGQSDQAVAWERMFRLHGIGSIDECPEFD